MEELAPAQDMLALPQAEKVFSIVFLGYSRGYVVKPWEDKYSIFYTFWEI